MSSLSKSVADDMLKIMSPFSLRAMFWKARHLDGSPMLEHLPFLFWLVEVHRPRLHVSLGVREGSGYFGICQAIDRLEPGARNVGIDSWPDSARETWRKILQINEETYSDVSQLIESDPTEFEPEFQKGSIDLLLLDHEITPNFSERIGKDWLPRLSGRGIIVINGIMRAGGGESTYAELLAELREGRPSIRFETGDGIDVILYGEEQSEYLRILASLSVEDASYSLVHAIFARLGAAHRFEWISRNNQATVKAAEARASAAREKLVEITGKLVDLERDYHDRSRRAAEFQSRCFDLEQVAKTAEAERDQMHCENEALKKRHAGLDEVRGEATARDKGHEEVQAQPKGSIELKSTLELAATTRDQFKSHQWVSELETQLATAGSRAAATKSFLVSIEKEFVQFASIAQAQAQDISHLKTKLLEADVRLATRERELSIANVRADKLQIRLKSLPTENTGVNARQVRERSLAAKLQNERAFIRTLELKFQKLTEDIRATKFYGAKSPALPEKKTVNNTFGQETVTRAVEDVEILRRLDLRGTAMASLSEENVRLQAENAELLQKYEALMHSMRWVLASPARKAVRWLRKSTN